MKTDSQTYRNHLSTLRSLGHQIYNRESIHHDERDFTSVIYTFNDAGQRVCNTVAYCDPPFSQHSECHYEIYNLGEHATVMC